MFRGFRQRKKFKKFAEEVQEATEQRSDVIYIIGYNIYAEKFVQKLIELGAENRTAIISPRELLWMSELPESIKILIEDKEEEFLKPRMYESIGFNNAEKIVVLLEDPNILQSIISHVPTHTDAEIIMLSRFAPQFVKYIAKTQRSAKVRIVEDVRPIVREILGLFEFDMSFPLVYSIPVEEKWEGLTIDKLEIPGAVALKIEREFEQEGKKEKKIRYISPKNVPLQFGDKIIYYITKKGSLRTFVSALSNLSIEK